MIGGANAQQSPTDANALILKRLEQIEGRLNQIQGGAAGQPQTVTPGATTDRQALLDRIAQLEQRLGDLETNAVLSSPKTLVKQLDVYVDANGQVHDEPVPGAHKETTYQRERVYRRQNIDEAIEEALAGERDKGIEIGVSSVTTAQVAAQTKGPNSPADGHVYGLSAADVTFAAKSAALNTTFFADVVGIGGSPPDQEIQALNLLNGQTARLSNNQLSLREAWIRTGVFQEKLKISLGRLDLTSIFDRNTVANDENSQFISDALVNNPVLGLSENGLGVAAVWDPKGSYNIKVGVQQSSSSSTNLNDSVFSLAEFEYIARPFGLGEGHYRLWGRLDNSTGDDRTAFGVSIDQKLSAAITAFARYGSGFVGGIRGAERFYSGGLSFGAPYAFDPDDYWGIGYSQSEIKSGPQSGAVERLAEAFYNRYLTEHLRVSGMLQYVLESETGEGYILPGVRLQVGF